MFPKATVLGILEPGEYLVLPDGTEKFRILCKNSDLKLEKKIQLLVKKEGVGLGGVFFLFFFFIVLWS